MRLCTYRHGGETHAGAIADGDRVVALGEGDLLELLVRLGEAALLDRARDALQHPSVALRLSDVELLAPFPRPLAITAVGLNYKDHAAEQGKEAPALPMLFAKHPSCVNAPFGDVELPRGREHIDYECELAFAIGKAGDRIPREKALDHVLGFFVLNDVSDRKAQKEDGQFHRAKSWRGFAPMGPWLVTSDAFNFRDAAIRTRVNGETRQESRTSQLIFDVPFLVEYVSNIHPLAPGDVISTGTPGGVGVFRNPKVFLKAGDVVECEIEGIGTLRNRFVAPA
jgi:2-keto-4-pentenoate hydratase/2-oxohepta-3-ene-1,7-dioic acid hydratase in catechol pathway